MPNHSIEGMSSRLRRLATPHVKRYGVFYVCRDS